MNIFDVLNMIGGLSLFLFGMTIMGQALERKAGGKLRQLLGKMTESKFMGFATGVGITAIIQSSSATTVMVVGFVNSGLMTLKQAINVILGANVGTTATAWLLSLAGISGGATWVKLLKPAAFTPVLAFIGIICFMFCKSAKKKDTGIILLGFATLMFGMETMSASVAGLAKVPEFRNILLLFTNPLLGVLAGTVLTAVIQSSSASVGILQALAVTGQVTYGAAIPIIMGQNIGTCATALISSVGTNTNAKRAAAVHLAFNVTGTAICLSIFYLAQTIFNPQLLAESATMLGIAVSHSVFNVFCTALLLPATGMLEKIVVKLIPEKAEDEDFTKLDERLLATPPLALEQSRQYAVKMAEYSVASLKDSLSLLKEYNAEKAEKVRDTEKKTDKYEDVLGSYLLQISSAPALRVSDNEEITALLKLIGDFERIADHAVNIVEAEEELMDNDKQFSAAAQMELSVLCSAVSEVLDLTLSAFEKNDTSIAQLVEPLEEVIDNLKEELRTNHILRMKKGDCSVEAGFVWSDILTDLERVSDHCSNIAGCVIDLKEHALNLHETLSAEKKTEAEFRKNYDRFAMKYALKKGQD